MPTPSKGARLGGSPSHERKILANLSAQLITHGQITTTESRARRLRPVVERLITIAKRGDLAARRRVLRTITDKGVVHALFTEVAPQMAERNGGYTRIIKVAPRKGDNAPMAVIELVTEPVSPKQAVVREATKAAEKAAKVEDTKVESAESAESAESPESAESAASAPSAASAEETAEETKA